MASNEPIPGLTYSEERLVIDLAADFSEAIQAGKSPSVQEYAKGLPNQVCREAFTAIANMSSFNALTTELTQTMVLKEGDACPLGCGGTILIDSGAAICDTLNRELPPHYWEVGEDNGKVLGSGKTILEKTHFAPEAQDL